MSAKRGLIIFIRNPELGKVKTRLAKSLGNAAALDIYCRLLAHTRAVALEVQAERYLFYADRIDTDDGWQEEHFSKQIQHGGDLGERMLAAFRDVAAAACDQMIIIGSDCPQISAALIDSAFEQLLKNDVVIGPATDGGYYLLGMRKPCERLFTDKAWSTVSVFKQTMADIEALGLRCFELPMLTDIDTHDDLPAMQHLL